MQIGDGLLKKRKAPWENVVLEGLPWEMACREFGEHRLNMAGNDQRR
jgi:hypothetical protein